MELKLKLELALELDMLWLIIAADVRMGICLLVAHADAVLLQPKIYFSLLPYIRSLSLPDVSYLLSNTRRCR